MHILIDVLFFALGIVFLYLGGVFIVDGSVRIAQRLKIPTIVIGLTVVAMGTSTPELFTSINASFAGESGIALGNVIGSNIFNIVFVLSLSVFFMPLKANEKMFKMNMMAMFAIYFLLILFVSLDVLFKRTITLSVLEGVILVVYLCLYIIYLYKIVSKDKSELSSLESSVSSNSKSEKIVLSIIKVVVAIAFLALGSDLFVKSSVSIFSMFISKHVIGIVVVAVGTSIPELVTSVIAAYKKQSDISVGNIIGSNIFNVGAVLGISSIVDFGMEFERVGYLDFTVMVSVGILLYIFMRKNKPLKIRHGVIFLTIYFSYVAFLIYSGRV